MRSALAHDPDNHRALKYLAETYLGRGYVSEAEKFYRRALEIEPNDPVCLNNLGVCLLRAGRKLDSAIAFKAAILADPTMALAKSNTKNVLSNFLGLGASGIVLIQVLLVSLLWGGHFYLSPATAEEDSSAPAFLAVSLAVTVIAFIGIRFWKHRRLRSADPQIMDIYRRLRKDREVK